MVMKYARQPHKPSWFQSDASKIYESATSGTSPFNEWYEFEDRAEAIELFTKEIDSHHDFLWIGSEIFRFEDLAYDEDEDVYILAQGTQPAPLSEIAHSFSRF